MLTCYVKGRQLLPHGRDFIMFFYYYMNYFYSSRAVRRHEVQGIIKYLKKNQHLAEEVQIIRWKKIKFSLQKFLVFQLEVSLQKFVLLL